MENIENINILKNSPQNEAVCWPSLTLSSYEARLTEVVIIVCSYRNHCSMGRVSGLWESQWY